jgi:hypothetical protein
MPMTAYTLRGTLAASLVRQAAVAAVLFVRITTRRESFLLNAEGCVGIIVKATLQLSLRGYGKSKDGGGMIGHARTATPDRC